MSAEEQAEHSSEWINATVTYFYRCPAAATCATVFEISATISTSEARKIDCGAGVPAIAYS
jgi:hypothetical protein